jgi:hypothetical protein
MDHEPGGQLSAARNDRMPDRTSSNTPALREQLWTTPQVDRSVDTLSTKQVRMCRVDNGVHILLGDVSFDELNPRRCNGGLEHAAEASKRYAERTALRAR